jgi:hypothetical protein
MEDLRKEFEELMKKDEDESCETNSCEKEPLEEYPDFIVELTTQMLVPDRCGIYFSKKDFREMGLANELSISLKQRSRMVTDLLKSIFTKEDMERVFDTIHSLIDYRISIYDELSTHFPASKEHFDSYKQKALTLKKRLDRILRES